MRVSAKRGVTALELMVVLAVLAVLLALALPAWQDLAARQRRNAMAEQLNGHLALARSAAISKGRPVAVSTMGVGWHSGWRVHLDDQRNGQWDAGESVLAEQEGDPMVRISGNGSMGRYALFDPDGRPRQSGGGFLSGRLEVCTPDRLGVTVLIMSAAGRIRRESRETNCSG